MTLPRLGGSDTPDNAPSSGFVTPDALADSPSKGKKPPKVKRPSNPGRNRQLVKIVAAGGAAVLVAGGLFAFVQANTSPKVGMYALATDVATNQPILPENLAVVEVDASTVPANPVTRAQLESSTLFARSNFPAGTLLTESVVATALRTVEDLPAGYTVGSFTADPAQTVAGRVRAGDRISIYAVGEDAAGSKVSKLVLTDVEVLNVQADLSEGQSGDTVDPAEKPGPDNPLYYGGVPQVYTVALTYEQAAIMTLVKDADIYVVLVAPNAPADANVSVTEQDVFAPNRPAVGPKPVVDDTAAPDNTTEQPQNPAASN